MQSAGRVAGLILFLGLLVGLAQGASAPGRIEASSPRLVKVTVFPDRAEVVREAKVDLPAGPATVVFPGLPWNLEPDSLRVAATGVPARLGAVDLKHEVATPEESAEMVTLRAEMRGLDRQVAELSGQNAVAGDLREFLTAIRATTAGREGESLGEGKADPAAVVALYEAIGSRLNALNREGIERQEHLLDINKRREIVRKQLAQSRPEAAAHSRTALVDVESAHAGAITFTLTFMVPRASWRPAYRAELDPATGMVSLESEAVVRQTTGEDWTGVTLQLSTASPARGVSPPELPTLTLRPADDVAGFMSRSKISADTAEELPILGRNFQDLLTIQGGVTDPAAAEPAPAQPLPATPSEAEVRPSAYQVFFAVPGLSDVAADGQDHRVGLRHEVLVGTTEYRTVPALAEAAYVLARVNAPADYPLLEGPVRVFAGGAFLGSFNLAESGPGAELVLPFGVDHRIEVERSPRPGMRSERGVGGRERILTHAFQTTVRNHRDVAVAVLLEDRIPVSEDERIKVEIDRESTSGWRKLENRPGVIEWTLALEPHATRVVDLIYTVRKPVDLAVVGLEGSIPDRD